VIFKYLRDFLELRFGNVTIRPSTAAKTRLTNDTDIVVKRPPIKNSILDDPWEWKGLIANQAKL
jgi:hypothetical protein